MGATIFLNEMLQKLKDNGITNANELYFIIEAKLGLSRADIAMLETFSRGQQRLIQKWVRQRIKGKSMQLIIGSTPFAGIIVLESKHTLTPRPETEYLTTFILKHKPCKVLDICTGSGCIGLALAKASFDVTLSDISTKALRCARKNAKLNNLKVNMVKSNMFNNIQGKFDIIVSNPPYITTTECKTLQREVVLNDPYLALDGGADGLYFYAVISEQAHKFLVDNGIIYLEIGAGQEKSIVKLLEKNFKDITIIKDLNGVNRIIKAVKK